jgi:hypothetical protein
LCYDSLLTIDNTSVGVPKSFHKRNGTTVILDFEESIDDKNALIYEKGNVNTFFDTENRDEKLDDLIFDSRADLPTPVQGNGFIYVKGVDLIGEPNSFYIGGFNGNAIDFKLDPTMPRDSIYFNFYANSNGNKTTKIVVKMEGIGGDIFKIERVVTWTGWGLVSAKLSDFILGTAGALGPGKIFPGSLKRFNIEIHSGDGPGKEAELLVDYVNFTYGKPFSQAN